MWSYIYSNNLNEELMNKITHLALGFVLLSAQQLTSQILLESGSIDTKEIFTDHSSEIRYYYYPNLQAYFDIQTQLYIVKQNGSWSTSKTIDVNSRGYCLRNGFHVPLKGFVADEPYLNIKQHKLSFPADYSSKQRRKPLAVNE
jgi:hypothetical protein